MNIETPGANEVFEPLKVEILKGPNKNEVSLSPERGGIVTSIVLEEKEILYLDPDNFNDREQKVRGGVPILYPNAGPLEENDIYDLKQHGYARMSDKWEVEKYEEGELCEVLKASDETRAEYPFDTAHRIKLKPEEDGSVTIIQEVENLENEKEAPVSMGLHPYFKVNNGDKKDIKFDFDGGEIIEKDFDNWSEGGTTSIDNPKLKDPEAVLKVTFPGLGTITMDISAEYKKIWVWTEPGKDFVCVEPVMRDPNGLIDDPELVKPGNKLRAQVNYKMD